MDSKESEHSMAADGTMSQQFDYFRDPTEKEFTVMCCSPSGQVSLGIY